MVLALPLDLCWISRSRYSAQRFTERFQYYNCGVLCIIWSELLLQRFDPLVPESCDRWHFPYLALCGQDPALEASVVKGSKHVAKEKSDCAARRLDKYE